MRGVPAIGPRYWAALCLASVLGCNLGDFVSSDLQLGHWRGLPVLACAFALVLAAERRSKRPSEAWYWLAIVVIRTAATNLADLAVHDFKLPYPLALAVLAVLLAVLAAVNQGRAGRGGLPVANGWFWAAMLAAGTLGTAAGDGLADGVGLGVAASSGAMAAVMAVALALRRVPDLAPAMTFWVAVVAIRTWGTNAGDWLADHAGLTASTADTGAAFAALLLVWRTRPQPAPAAALAAQGDALGQHEG